MLHPRELVPDVLPPARSQGHYKRATSRDEAEARVGPPGRPQGAGDTGAQGVTVITIGGQGEQQEGQGILPAVLRDKPRISTGAPPPRQQVAQLFTADIDQFWHPRI